MLVGVAPDGADEWLTVQWGCLRAVNLFIICGQVEPARQVLADVKDRVDSEAVVGFVKALDLSFRFFSGDVATAIETGPSLCGSDVLPLATLWAAVATSLRLALAGRFGDVHRIADAGLRAAALSESGSDRFTHRVGRVHGVDGRRGFPCGRAGLGTLCRNDRGRAGSRRDGVRDAWGRPACPGCADVRVFCLSRLDLGDVAWFSVGLADAGVSLVRAGRRCAGRPRGSRRGAAQFGGGIWSASRRVFAGTRAGPGLGAGLRWPFVGRADACGACRADRATIRDVRRRDVVRYTPLSGWMTVRKPQRLAELAETLNTPLAEAIAEHARGLADQDGDLLDAAADRFADMGAVALAADAAAQAAREHARTGHRGKEVKSSTRAHWLASQDEIRTPAVDAAARPLPITDREREIAMLVVAGLSNRQIADRLFVSVRTVEGHLYRIFAKLGIEHRDQLVHLARLAWHET